MAAFTKDGGHGIERYRTQSEGSNVKHCPVERQRTLSDQQSDRITSIRNRSSGWPHITDEASSIDSGSRSSIQESDALCDRKDSAGSNSAFTFDTQDESKYRGMVKVHYISTSTRSTCRQCNKKFSVKLRPHHCRRCGDIYCMSCLRYRRKLNKLANLDPNGKPRKVCKACFTEEGGTIGRTRNLKDEFFKERQLCKHERVLRQRTFSLTDTFWRDQLDMEKECSRLLRGFSEAVGTSEAKKTLHELHQLVKPPNWQKSSFWKVEKSAAHCRACKGSLGIRKKKRNCKVCGLALCKKCSNKELLLYIEGGNSGDRRTQSKLGIIKFVGCPEKEPDISLLLHVCKDCKEYISHQQTTAPPPSNSLATLFSMNDQFTELQNRISPLISECKQIFESLELSDKQDNAGVSRLSDLLDQISKDLDTYERLFHKLRHLGKKAESGTQNTLFKHYTMAKYDFYMDNRHTYRRLRKTAEPDQINSISNVTKPNAMTEISSITKSIETRDQRPKELEKDPISDYVVDATAGSSTNVTKVQTETEERKTEHVKRSSSFFDRNLRLGSFKKGKSKKKQLRLDSENNLLSDVDENKAENGGNPSSEEHLKQTVKFAKEIIENSNGQQSSVKPFIDIDALRDRAGSSKQTLEQAEPPETNKCSLRNTGKLGFTDEATANIEKQSDNNEENSTVSVKRNNSFFDRKLRPGSFLKRQANKKPFKPDSERKVIEDDSAETSGTQYSKKQIDQVRVSTADTTGEQTPDQISFKAFDSKESIVQYNKAPEETFETAASTQSANGSSLGKSDKIVLPDKTTTDSEVKADNNEENSSAFDRKARKGSFFKRKTKKNELKADPARQQVEVEEKTVNVEACGHQSTVSEQTTEDQTSTQSANGSSLGKSDKTVLPDKTTTDSAVKADNNEENSSAFDKKARKGSFFKRKTKKNELKADPARQQVEVEEKTVNVEACGHQSTVSEQTTKDQTSDQNVLTDFPKTLEVNGCTSKNPSDPSLEERSSADLETVSADNKENTSHSVKRNNSFFDRQLRPGSFLKRKPKQKTFKSDSETIEIREETTEGTKTTETIENFKTSDKAETSTDGKTSRISGEVFLKNETVSWKR